MPNVVIVAGPNGAGKSTVAPTLLRELLGVDEFVNADVIARGLSAFDPEGAAIAAGRIMLRRLRDLARQRVDFAFETTLASRVFAPWIAGLIEEGYVLGLVYLWVPSAEVCLRRVSGRVRAGGHHVPDEVVRRRYEAGIRNFFRLYRPLADRWKVYENSSGTGLRLIAEGAREQRLIVYDEESWSAMLARLRDAKHEEA